MSILLQNNSISTINHDRYFNQLFDKEFGRLEERGQTYLDYTGGGIYGSSQLKEHFTLLSESAFGNPHSSNPTSRFATSLVEETREAVLDYFKAHDYYCIFTQNASNAIKIVGECYPFGENSKLLLLADNHNSINGIRSYCTSRNGTYQYAGLTPELRIDPADLNEQLSVTPNRANKLFAFPAQSNASGVQHNLNWVKIAKQRGWDVLLDTSAFVPTSKLDLSVVRPDFVALSFYKMFGYPTGIGCLLVRETSFEKLKKPWFAGGTVKLVSVKTGHHFLAEAHERYENGTIDYLSIPAIKIGLDFLREVGIERINSRVESLTQYLFQAIYPLHHGSGIPIVKIYGPENRKECGGSLTMNLFDALGKQYPFKVVEDLANTKSISIRTGCFCNPGVDEINHAISSAALNDYFNSRATGNYDEMAGHLNIMRGAVRVSVGIATRKQDLDFFIDFVHSFKDLINKGSTLVPNGIFN